MTSRDDIAPGCPRFASGMVRGTAASGSEFGFASLKKISRTVPILSSRPDRG